ncbi:DUF3179 domain-containing protein [Flagellimonas pacifica]|uniref:DUF3179 domain-containing protein n=1 Tax=Flagellimonas pacifica TaxID=1247520 RepID=A0A285MBD8_9FLAO|nr:DUF3179 domain-containing protein [Allomuricauda parva]SNY94470.1 Protein of unknown function [Allomuricauda parva]
MKNWILVLTSVGLLVSCSSSSVEESTNEGTTSPEINSQWSIPVAEVLDGGPGRDGIPALENPNFTTALGVDFLGDDDLIIGFKNGEDVRGYPHIILNWHEIINDNIGDASLAITYCPLTGTGIGWGRVINGRETTFGVSGLLYNTNLIPFDRETLSNWSQILNESVNGVLTGQKASLSMLFETDWKTWKQMYPNSQVVNLQTGFSRTYEFSPYGNYSSDNNLFLFPVSKKDTRLPSKERVLAITNDGDAKAYRFGSFQNQNIIKDAFKGRNYLIVGNQNFMVAFEPKNEHSTLEFTYVFNGESDVLIEDNEGGQWDIFGYAVSGPRMGERLATPASFMAYWFSIPAFYQTAIYLN